MKPGPQWHCSFRVEECVSSIAFRSLEASNNQQSRANPLARTACLRWAGQPRIVNLDERHAMSTAIAIEGVTKRFGSVVAVDNLDLRCRGARSTGSSAPTDPENPRPCA